MTTFNRLLFTCISIIASIFLLFQFLAFSFDSFISSTHFNIVLLLFHSVELIYETSDCSHTGYIEMLWPFEIASVYLCVCVRLFCRMFLQYFFSFFFLLDGLKHVTNTNVKKKYEKLK